MTLKKFVITETCEYEIRAVSMAHAKKRWLTGDVWALMKRGFLAVRERTIAPTEPDPQTPTETF